MTDSPSLCIADTNVLVDLHNGGVLAAMFLLPYTFGAPDVIVAELQVPDGQSLVSMGLRSEELPAEQVLEVAALAEQHRTVSVNDLFALVLARYKSATLLTGDRRLRQLADREGIRVHGVLWVLDEMVRLERLSAARAASALEAILACGARLPRAECDGRLRRWTA